MVRTLRSAVLGYTGTSPRMCRLSAVSPRISWRFTRNTGAPRCRIRMPFSSTSGRSRNAGSRYDWLYQRASTLPLSSLTSASSTLTRRRAVSRVAHDRTVPRRVHSTPMVSSATSTSRDGSSWRNGRCHNSSPIVSMPKPRSRRSVALPTPFNVEMGRSSTAGSSSRLEVGLRETSRCAAAVVRPGRPGFSEAAAGGCAPKG